MIAPAPDRRNVFGYVRVSKEREGQISPEIQRDAITAYCETRGWSILEWFVDVDLSGRLPPEKRPGLQELLSRARAHECDTVVVYRVDRLSREPADYYAILAVLQEAGVGIDAAAQPRDPTPEGNLLWDLSAILARYESLKLGSRIKDAHKRIAATGRYHGGQPPYGLRANPDAPGLIVHPEEAPWVRRMHDWYQRGWSIRGIARELNREGVASKRGNSWAEIKVRNVLQSPYQVGGRLVDGRLVLGDNVEPVVPLEVWERTQALRRARSVKPEAGRVPSNGLRGRLVRCGTCGGALEVHYQTNGRMIYRCQGPGRGTCTQGTAISAHILEPIIQQRLIGRLRGSRAPQMPKSASDDLRPLREDLDAVRASLVRLATAYAEEQMARDEYQGARSKLIDRQGRLEKQLEKKARVVETRLAQETLALVWEDLGRLTVPMIAGLPAAAKRELYELVIERVVVNPMGREPRIHLRFRW